MSLVTVLIYLIGFFILYILCRIFLKPLKWLLGLFVSCIIGCIAMLAANMLLDISFALNPLTAMISGVLGLPGMIMAYILGAIL